MKKTSEADTGSTKIAQSATNAQEKEGECPVSKMSTSQIKAKQPGEISKDTKYQ